MDIDSSILEMRKQPHLSASSIKAYLDCGLYYKFSRVDKMQRTHTSDNLLFGSTIHRVLADYNQEKIIGNHMGLEDLTQLFEKYWKEAVLNNTDNILYSKGKSYESLLEQGKKLIKTYMVKLQETNMKSWLLKNLLRLQLMGLICRLLELWIL